MERRKIAVEEIKRKLKDEQQKMKEEVLHLSVSWRREMTDCATGMNG